jgi:hypothetical protein
VSIVGAGQKARAIPFAALHRQPGETPDVETTLRAGELIAFFSVPAEPWTRRSLFLKVRDRKSYEFALAAAAVALDLDGDKVREARIALGGVATVPWRAKGAEEALRRRTLDDQAIGAAAEAAFANARGRAQRFQDRTRQAHARARAAAGGRIADLARRAGDANSERIEMANAAAPAPGANMGEPTPRLDARLKVTGEARYASDFPVSNPAFAYLVTSTIAKGRITALDLAEARAVPGVLEILTHENTGDLKAVAFGSASTSTQQLGPEIDHDGQIVAVVLADTFEAAREAARRVRVTYAAATPSATFGAQGLTEDDATKVSERIKEAPAAGDVEVALAAADVVIDAEYATPAQHHNPIELFTTTCAWHDNRLTIYEPSQFVYGLKNSTAKKLGIDPGQVRVVSPFVGGAFGAKGQLTPRTGLIALAAKRLNRPVKLVASRDQGFTIATYRAETRHHIRLGAKADGKLVGYSHEGWEISSRRDPYCVAGVEDSARLYAFGAVGTKVNIVHADRNTPGFMRSPPVVPYIYALETAMDELAAKLRMDRWNSGASTTP